MQVIIVKAEIQFIIKHRTIKVIDCNTGLSNTYDLPDASMDQFMEYQFQYQSGLLTINDLLQLLNKLMRI